ncbi:MAG: hypothetical protein HFJ65_04595 [Eggerthellaceae bacterium]|nr:hypothetical protein [Eggerthellaceae bacterium]
MERIDENSYPDCKMCARCCSRLSVLAITEDEYHAMLDAVKKRGITPIDRGDDGCPLLAKDGSCMIWDARPQVCKLYSCQMPRHEVLANNPQIKVHEKVHLVCLREMLIPGVSPRSECA